MRVKIGKAEHLIPGLFSYEAQAKHARYVKRWQNYARAITQNPTMERFIRERDGIKCAYCKLPIRKRHNMHHVNYDRLCHTQTTVKAHRPTPSLPLRTLAVPDCASCKANRPRDFEKCSKRLVLVHPLCNKALHEDHLVQRRARLKSAVWHKKIALVVVVLTVLFLLA